MGDLRRHGWIRRGRGPSRPTPIAKANPERQARRRARYAGFLRSAAWRAIRLETFRLADWTCVLCGWRDETETGRGLVADHLSYARFGGREIPGEDTRSLCRACDRRITPLTRTNWATARRKS